MRMRKYRVPMRGSFIDWEMVILITLRTVTVGALLSTALLAPNAMQIFKLFKHKDQKANKYCIDRATKSLLKKGLITKTKDGHFRLTKSGDNELRNFEFQTSSKKQKWDKRWRLVIFDIEEKRRGTRDRVREYISNAGFVLTQKSVWVYPYPCQDIIELLKKELSVSDGLIYAVVDHFEDEMEASLRKRFNLE